MERILIIGCGGAGKSTLARQLGDKLNIPVVHLDKLFWKPGWVEIPKDEFDALIRQEMAEEKWIMDGNFNRTLPERIARCDTVIYLDFSRFACLLGIIKRVLTTYGKVRPDMGEGCPERIDWEFLKWVWNIKKNKREGNYKLLWEAQHAEIIVLKKRKEVKAFLEQVMV